MNANQKQTLSFLSQRTDLGIVLILGIGIGWMGMYFSTVRPLQHSIQDMQSHVSTMESSMLKLVGAREDVFHTNDLLGMLRQQDRLLAGATTSLNQLKTVRDEISSLNQQMVEDQTQLVEAQKTLASFKQLKSEILAQNEHLSEMQVAWNELKTLQNELHASRGEMASLNHAWANIEVFHEKITDHSEQLHHAINVAEGMMNLSNTLATTDAIEMQASSKTLDQMVDVQTRLMQQAHIVPKTLKSMEVLSDLEHDITASMTRVYEMRRTLTDITLLETGISQAMKVLEPLSQLADLRRLSPEDLQEVSRNIIARRINHDDSTTHIVTHQNSDLPISIIPSSLKTDVMNWIETEAVEDTAIMTEEQTENMNQAAVIMQVQPPMVDMPE
jgi:DNA repair exonuclease SbcCD ATPase subunit